MTRLYITLSFVLTALALIATLLVYPQLPEKVPIHWNVHGQVDGWGEKSWVWLTPGIQVGLLLLFGAIPWLSPKQFEIDSFRSTYWYILLVLTAMFVYLHGLLVWAAWSGQVDITRAMLAGMLIMFSLLGNVLGKVRRNYYVGVRTPWTLASERVWNDTHRLAARMFVGAGIIGLLAVVLPVPVAAAIISVVVLLMAAGLVPAVYSLVLYKRLQKLGELDVVNK
ncbi:MAG: SdpI family protein [Pirellulaceae bacterium]|nr:SdpI family protein [Pirellulaceae bacterium]